MGFYGMRHYGARHSYAALPTFDLTADSVYLGSLSSKISKAQSVSLMAAPLAATDAPFQGIVSGLEQAIATAHMDLMNAVDHVNEVAAGRGDTGVGHGKKMLEDYNYSGGGGHFQEDLLAWRKSPGNDVYRPDPGDYQYPGGAGQLDEAQRAWRAAAARRADSARDTLSGLLDQYNSTVPNAAQKIQEVIDSKKKLEVAEVKHATATTDTGTIETATKLFNAQQSLISAQKAASAATAAVAAPPSKTPLIIAAVAIPVIGVAIYALTRKKSAAVAGYRHRRRSRR